MTFGKQDLRIALGVAAIFAVSFAVYWPALRGDFLWDDLLNILSNPTLQTNRGLLDIWLGRRDVYDYYPMTWTTWWLEWRTWRRETLGYHVLNVILHAAAASMMWRVLVRLAIPGAFVAAMIFALHPVNVESVAWISERKNTLSMFLLAVMLALYLEYEKAEGVQRRRFYWASVVTFALTLLAKPSIVALPAVLLALAWWRRGRITRQDWLASIPMFLLSTAISIITVIVHHGRSIVTSEIRDDSFLSRLMGAGWAVWFYLYKLLWPANVAFVYPRWELNTKSWAHWLPLAALAATFLALFLMRRRIGRGPLTAMLCYALMLAPVLGFINVYFMRFSLVSDHWQYPACFAVFALAVGTADTILRRLPQLTSASASFVITSLVCIALGVLSWRETHFYQTNRALWAEVIRDNPRCGLAYNNLGAEFGSEGRHDAAREYYRKAIEFDPRGREGYALMGASYMQENRPAEAVAWFRQAMQLPGSGRDPRIRLAEALVKLGQEIEAVELYAQALAFDPYAPVDRTTLAAFHEQRGDSRRAMALYRENVVIWPDEPEGWFCFASALRSRGQEQEARHALEELRRLCAGNHVALTSMGTRFVMAGFPDLAEPALRDAINTKPDYGPAHNHLGRALEAMDRLPEAARSYEQALTVQPGFRDAVQNFERVQERQKSTTQPSPTTR